MSAKRFLKIFLYIFFAHFEDCLYFIKAIFLDLVFDLFSKNLDFSLFLYSWGCLMRRIFTQMALTSLALTSLDFTSLALTQFFMTQNLFTLLALTPLALTPLALTPLAFTPLAFTSLVLTQKSCYTKVSLYKFFTQKSITHLAFTPMWYSREISMVLKFSM